MKLIDIAVSWYRVISGNITSEQRVMAAARLDICDSCPYKLQMNAAGELIMGILNQADNTFYCGQCGCPIAAKVVKKENECPLKRWAVPQEEDYF